MTSTSSKIVKHSTEDIALEETDSKTVMGNQEANSVPSSSARAISKPTAQEEGLFIHFPDLPLELRERIWESYDNEPHVINAFEYGGGYSIVILKYRCKGVLPFTGVNMESRRVALRRHRPLAQDTGMFVDLSTDVFNFYSEDSLRSSLEFGWRKTVESSVDAVQGNVLTLTDFETKLRHVTANWNGRKAWRTTELIRLAGLKTITFSYYTANGEKSREILTWEEKFKAAWTAKNGERSKPPQLIWANPHVYFGSLTGETRSWLNQSAEGEWSWEHGVHSEEARCKGWIPRKEGRDTGVSASIEPYYQGEEVSEREEEVNMEDETDVENKTNGEDNMSEH